MRRALPVLAIVLAVLGALALHVVRQGRAAVAAGDELARQGKPAEAVAAYEAAARWYLPLAPHVDDAYARLRRLAADPATALPAWRAIRRAARATRGAWTPHAADLAAADAAIARILARDPAAGAGAGTTPAARTAWHRARLAHVDRPGTTSSLLAVLGLVAFVAGAFVLARRGLDAAGGLVRRPALAGAVSVLVGLVAWAVGLYTA